MAGAGPEPSITEGDGARRPATGPALWVDQLTLTEFRNYDAAALTAGRRPVVLVGPNGAGKTNILEAVSLLAAGQGLRRAPYPELARIGGSGGWAVAARVATDAGIVEIGTGLAFEPGDGERVGRIVHINGQPQSGSGKLADHVEMVWLTPAMDGLFAGPASERRRFLDRLILCFDPGYRTRAGRFERAMQQRNRLLADGVRDDARFTGLERVMAETGVAIAAARSEAVAELAAISAARRDRDPASPFPWASVTLDGALERDLHRQPAVELEDAYLRTLRSGRERDRAAGRTLHGPHRSDLLVSHGPKAMPARVCSTGEQKALLVGLVLAHAELTAQRRGAAPILLLDEIAAHLDEPRRAALFAEILGLGTQAWMTGNDRTAFAVLTDRALFLSVEAGQVSGIT